MKDVTVTIYFRGVISVFYSVLRVLDSGKPITLDYMETLNRQDLVFSLTEQSNATLINIPIDLYFKFNNLYHNLKG